MIWHIVTRELYDHLTSLRFALTTFILVALMVTNAVVHLQTHPEQVRKYSEKVIRIPERIEVSNPVIHAAAKWPR